MRFGFHRLQAAELSTRRISAILAVVIALICAAVANALAVNWQSDSERASRDAANISTAISQDILRNVELFDLSLRGAAEDYINPAVQAASPDLRQLILFDRAASASYLGKIIIIDAAGNLVASSRSADPQPPNYADRSYFRIQAREPNAGLFISEPLISRLSGQQVIVFSRRITNPDGSFGGVVAGTMMVDYVHHLFEKMNLGSGGSLTLFRTDGSLLMREPLDRHLIGQHPLTPSLLEDISRADTGEYRGRSVIDQVERLYRFQRIGRLPLIACVGFAITDIHREWWRRTLLIGSVVVVCCLLLVALNLQLTRELRSRVAAEAALTALADKDGLTGLANRRCFDRAMHAAWAQAAEERAPLAVLMVDADYFKAYNDCFGHAAGDAALRSIADCLSAHTDHPGQIAARYGGEEFAVILPRLRQDAVVDIANAVREDLAAAHVPHPASPHGRLTISIGCAIAYPHEGGSIAQLCARADAALYKAKRMGRNATSATWMTGESLRRAS